MLTWTTRGLNSLEIDLTVGEMPPFDMENLKLFFGKVEPWFSEFLSCPLTDTPLRSQLKYPLSLSPSLPFCCHCPYLPPFFLFSLRVLQTFMQVSLTLSSLPSNLWSARYYCLPTCLFTFFFPLRPQTSQLGTSPVSYFLPLEPSTEHGIMLCSGLKITIQKRI